MLPALMCLWLAGTPAPLACIDPQACQVRASIINHQERRPVAACRIPE